MDIIPFNYSEDEDYNEVYRFIFTSDTRKSNRLEDCHKTKIIIDGLNDALIIKQNCTCQGNRVYKKICKHIREAKLILSKFGIDFREVEVN